MEQVNGNEATILEDENNLGMSNPNDGCPEEEFHVGNHSREEGTDWRKLFSSERTMDNL
jgi:hypothetical protein